jgi:hypothetical protein
MCALPSIIRGKSPVLESSSLGSVRGVCSNVHPYRKTLAICAGKLDLVSKNSPLDYRLTNFDFRILDFAWSPRFRAAADPLFHLAAR